MVRDSEYLKWPTAQSPHKPPQGNIPPEVSGNGMESPWNSFCGPWTWNTMSSIFPECFSSTPLKLYYCRWSGWWSTLSIYVIGLTSFTVYIWHWMPRISTASAAVMWGATGQRHSLPNKDAWIHYQGMGVIFQGPQTGISGMLFQLTTISLHQLF